MTTLPLFTQIPNILPVLKLILIPAGVMLARANGLAWPITTGPYLISDIILALAFEPILRILAGPTAVILKNCELRSQPS